MNRGRLFYHLTKAGIAAGPLVAVLLFIAYIGFKVLLNHWDYFENRTKNAIFGIAGVLVAIVLTVVLISRM